MNVRAGSGWQTVLADLSLILFMVTASAASAPPRQAASPKSDPEPVLPATQQPVAVWSAGADAPPLEDWLGQTSTDPRLRLTIVAPTNMAAAALALAAKTTRPARILLEPGDQGSILAMLTYDRALSPQRLSRTEKQP